MKSISLLAALLSAALAAPTADTTHYGSGTGPAPNYPGAGYPGSGYPGSAPPSGGFPAPPPGAGYGGSPFPGTIPGSPPKRAPNANCDPSTDPNSTNNTNPPSLIPIYPKKLSCDAAYDIPEAQLRAAIYIPCNFTYGLKPPVVLFPGTGNTGYETFAGNFIPLLTNVSWADPVWVNVPNFLFDDAQGNAEYAAYAVNYINAITLRPVTAVAWSQGNLDLQWAYKYFPSTRRSVTDHVGISGDFAGTTTALPSCQPACAPAVRQQAYLSQSNFVTALRANGGDSGYVPTTSIYSGNLDEIVSPQMGTNASAFLKDARGVGVSNVEVQTACPGQPAGGVFSHESTLYNPLGIALLKDAMANLGPGETSRLDLATVCSTGVAPGLNDADVALTEQAITFAVQNGATYTGDTTTEPPLKAYASGTGASCPF